jgi:hypothetical protein
VDAGRRHHALSGRLERVRNRGQRASVWQPLDEFLMNRDR